MKKFLLLVLIIISISVKSQTDPYKPSISDSLINGRIQDSIRDKELRELVNPNTVKVAPVVAPAVVMPAKVIDSVKIKQPVSDSVIKPAIVTEPLKDTLSVKPPPDTLDRMPVSAPVIAPVFVKPMQTGSLTNKQVLDSLRPNPPDTTKPQTQLIEVTKKDIRPDSLRKGLPLDSLSYDELLDYYVHEPEPISFYKGPDTGDSVYYVLNPLTIPTTTVYGDPLSNHRSEYDLEDSDPQDTINRVEQAFKPKIGLGMGRLGFYGDLNTKAQRSISMGRPAFDLSISQRLTNYLQLDFSVMFGKVGASERTSTRNENFRSEIRAGGLNLSYDFGNLIPARYTVRPYLSFGAYGFEFLSKTDVMDKNGNTYYYWSDGSIKNMAEGSPGSQEATELVRDYNYESDIRELNKDGFGKYRETAMAFPIGAGVIMKVTDRVDLKLNFQYYITTTDYIDGITEKSTGTRAGTKANDGFTYSSITLQYDLISKTRSKNKKYQDTLSDTFWFAFDKDDSDKDSIPDLADECQGTPEGAKVDARGCPLDDDNDGIPNYRDKELNTGPGLPVNDKGVAQTDAYWQEWYDNYLNDSIANDRTTEYAGNIYANVTKEPKVKKENFVVELVRYSGAIPTDELAFLLSIGDINTTTLDDGTTVVYANGDSDNLSSVIKRRDEFRTTGNKSAGVSRIKGNEIIQVQDEELQRLLQSEIEDLLNIDVNDTSAASIAAVAAAKEAVMNAAKFDTTQSVSEEVFAPDAVVYRVQLGAFKNRISTKVFNTSAGVLELKTGENIYRYVTKGYKTIEGAASVRADLVLQGYSDAFVSAYKGGKRIAMSEAGGTMEKNYKEDLSENKTFNTIDKTLLIFKVQLGPLKKASQTAAMDERLKDLAGVEKETTISGQTRYTAGGDFTNYDAVEKFRKDLETKGYTEAFIFATFKGELISQQEAMELLK
jgi:hypothetical protein